MTASAIPSPPPHWAGVLTDEQWLVGVDAVGEERLNDFHLVLVEVSEAFRDSFIKHLHYAAVTEPGGRATLIAIMRATDEAADRAEAARHLTAPASVTPPGATSGRHV